MAKTLKGFDDALTLISLFGFIALAFSSFTTFDLSSWQTSFIMIVAGSGLMLEGQILTLAKWGRNGIQGNELPLILTLVVGVFTLIAGILTLPFINLTGPRIETIVGGVAIFTAIFIAIQRWVI